MTEGMRFAPPIDPDNGKSGCIRIKPLGLAIARPYYTMDPREVRILATDPVLTYNPDQAVELGILSIADMQKLGYYGQPKLVTELKIRLGLPLDADEQARSPEAEKADKEVALIPLPNFGTMYTDELFKFWNEDAANAQSLRGTDPIGFSADTSKAKMLAAIKAELEKRGDPRAEAVFGGQVEPTPQFVKPSPEPVAAEPVAVPTEAAQDASEAPEAAPVKPKAKRKPAKRKSAKRARKSKK